MRRLIELLRGFPGHPSHPPFTDVTIGAYTVGTVLAVLARLGVAEKRTTAGAFLAVVLGLVFSVATVLTGFLDYLRVRKGTPLRRVVNLHWIVMTSASVLFLVSAFLLKDPNDSGVMTTAPAAVTVLAWLVLLLGGWIGGTMVFVYGMRVIMEPGTPPKDALLPKFRH
jgi:uncharacterized membrane protein